MSQSLQAGQLFQYYRDDSLNRFGDVSQSLQAGQLFQYFTRELIQRDKLSVAIPSSRSIISIRTKGLCNRCLQTGRNPFKQVNYFNLVL